MAAIKQKLTNIDMLKRLQYSMNSNCAETAKKILTGQSTVEHELKYCGGFMEAVLNGDYETALQRADAFNQIALLTPVN